MIKSIFSTLCVFFISFSCLFASSPNEPSSGPPPRKDNLEYNAPQLQRAEYILSTLVPDPQSYQLILSSRTTFGGEAWAPYAYSEKPTIIIYQGSLAPSRSNEEIAFMMAHELGHLNMYHNEKMSAQMEKIFTGPPAGISGTTFSIFFQKLQERQADMFGFNMYKQAGYSLAFFPQTLKIVKINPNLHFGIPPNAPRNEHSSLSMTDSHFSIKERFELLTQKAQIATYLGNA